MAVFIILIAIITSAGLISYLYFKSIINDILNILVVLDKIFDERYNDLSRAISQFQKYLPEYKNLIFDIQKSKADVAKVSKPKTIKELASKILNENALTLNINYLIDKCDFQKIHPDLKECVKKQAEYTQKINQYANEYNKLVINYKKMKEFFPFKQYSKMIGIDLDIDTIKTE